MAQRHRLCVAQSGMGEKQPLWLYGYEYGAGRGQSVENCPRGIRGRTVLAPDL